MFHKDFKLNNQSFDSIKSLLEFTQKNVPSCYQFLSDWFTSERLAVQTSGSTGTPKTILLEKVFMENSAYATGTFFDLPNKTTALLCMNPDFIAGKMMLVRALTLGWYIDVVEPSSKVPITKHYNFSAMVPMQVESSLNDLDKIDKLIVGGGAVSNNLLTKIQALKTQVFATYGMTETITHIAVRKLNNYRHAELDSASHQVYQALPNIKLSQDSRNCLVISVSKLSRETIITNDVVSLISETQFEWLGRFDNVINSGGVKLHPEKIEEKLSKVIQQRFFVTGIPDETLGEKLVLIVEGSKQNFDFESVEGLGKYELPKEIYFTKNFVETKTKKIQRNKTLDLIFDS